MNAIPAPRPVSLVHHPLPKGMLFTRVAIALAVAQGKEDRAHTIAEHRWGKDSPVAKILNSGKTVGLNDLLTKSSVVAGTTASANWAADLVSVESARSEFFALARERSLIGRIAGLRRVPLGTRLVSEASGYSAGWVGQGGAVPLSSATYSDDGRLPRLKVSALAVFSDELLASVDPAAETLIRDGLIGALVEAIDTTFVDPSNGGTTDVEPASITNGVTAAPSTGNGLVDVRNMIDVFTGDLERAILIGSPSSFAALHDPIYLPNVGVRGGEILGIPAIPSKKAEDTLILVDPDAVALGEGPMELSASNEATVQMLDNPTNNTVTPTATQMVALFQCDSTGILVNKFMNWRLEQPSVALVTGVATS